MIEWMKSFGINIWQWFVQNKDGITAFFMSGQAISFVAALIMLIKNLRGTKDNTASAEVLNKTLTNTNAMSDSIVNLGDSFKLLKNENDSLRTELAETEKRLQSANAEITNKLNAIVEVQAIVYSTIRDDSVRQTVNTILNNARYSEKNFKDELQTQVDELQLKFTEEMMSMSQKMNEAVAQVSTTLNAAEKAKEAMTKKMEDNIRY